MKLFKNKNTASLLSSPYMVWAFIFILVPLGMVIYYGFTTEEGFFTFENIATIAKPGYLKALIRSIRLALISTLVCLILAYPLGMILSSMKLTRNTYIVTLFILPMWMNFLLRTLTWMTLLEGKGVINTVLESIHLPTINIINTPSAIVLGMVYNFLPFMILPIYNSLSKIDENVINAARDLGADSLQTFLKITFPLSLPGVLSGITMVFIPALTTFAISSMLGGSKILLIGNIIEQEFTQLYDWHLGSGLSIVLMIFIFINMIIEALSDKQGGR
ncbi:spermidine/putrescine transport system permease protein [Butyrivibrio proteoclasticus]|uniref:Spermidine/putrescine transport system permease protein n=2 Tax=Butyrivibrio proteoclasticus TaxID=43305 RepID=A0A1I5QFK2_9FIRM|nr:ABC transporter permease [Butyrivibrio proteoclasticus]SFP45038.1 spermidine/putrescine transport system permease protein [Butyrivibrio proteoclasticus]